MNDDRFDTPDVEVPRDQWKRPLIRPADGGDLVAYTRASSLGGALESEFGLTRWKMRMVGLGLAARPDLVVAFNAHRDDKKKLNELVEEALEAAASSARATLGTAMHRYAEIIDSGGDPGFIPPEFERDVAAYTELTVPLFEHVVIEKFVVCDDLKVAGTPDRGSVLRQDMTAPDGTVIPAGALVVTDEKTSGSMDFGGIKFSVQLAVYSRALIYDAATETRRPWGQDGELPRTDWGLIVHCPAGEGFAELYWVDLTAGYELAKRSRQVMADRKLKKLVVASKTHSTRSAAAFIGRAERAPTVAELESVWWDADKHGHAKDPLLEACRARKAELVA